MFKPDRNYPLINVFSVKNNFCFFYFCAIFWLTVFYLLFILKKKEN